MKKYSHNLKRYLKNVRRQQRQKCTRHTQSVLNITFNNGRLLELGASSELLCDQNKPTTQRSRPITAPFVTAASPIFLSLSLSFSLSLSLSLSMCCSRFVSALRVRAFARVNYSATRQFNAYPTIYIRRRGCSAKADRGDFEMFTSQLPCIKCSVLRYCCRARYFFVFRCATD